ncbi:hypothetical protein QC823_13935 [Halomonas vilamensis]|uniref:Uncharacterized protein n=1 Tax=Vreelandella vilamensis TaxID=531309 RepID=A0ABU1H8C5_9GAMM|nr:hypothetical protein [Halomonas vilamensis]MDR5900081.1 hypothetical protein [Halomonas vilamensis]
MKRYVMIGVLASATLVAGSYFLKEGGRRRINLFTMRRKMMERMMKAMPDNSPPKVITSVLPRLQEQNEQILALLKEQNELLRSDVEACGKTTEDAVANKRR